MEAAELRSALRSFRRINAYHEHWSGLRFTNGVKFLVENAKAHWIVDVIALLQPKALRDPALREFQLWELFAGPRRTVRIVCSRDSEDAAFNQEIGHIDFPLGYVRLYVARGGILLPSEHTSVPNALE